jgi:hypothetical protein
MPLDSHHGGDDDDDDKKKGPTGQKSLFKEFDCPDCSANNPTDPPFGDADEVLCNYCGSSFKAKVSEEGKVKFKSL